MKQYPLSRGPGIDTQQCVRNAGANQFNLILYAAARARELKHQARQKGEFDHPSATVTALLEIQNGQVDTTRNPLLMRQR